MAGLLFAAFIGLATIACIGVVIWGSIGAVFGRRSPWQPPPSGSPGWRHRWPPVPPTGWPWPPSWGPGAAALVGRGDGRRPGHRRPPRLLGWPVFWAGHLLYGLVLGILFGLLAFRSAERGPTRRNSPNAKLWPAGPR